MDFELSVSVGDHCVVVAVTGECDMTSAADLRESLLGVLGRQSARLVLDLSGLQFLDCAGARSLVAASRRATLLGGALAVAAPADPVARLLQVTGLGARLTTYPTADAAQAALWPADRPPAPAEHPGSAPGAAGSLAPVVLFPPPQGRDRPGPAVARPRPGCPRPS